MYKRTLTFLLVLCMCFTSVFASTANAGTIGNSNESISVTAVNKDLVVIIPGTMGSELKYGSTIVWSPLDSTAGITDCFRWIACNETGGENYSITPYVGDSFGADDTYETLFTELYDEYQSSSLDVKFFAYDWRLSCVDAADELDTLVSGYNGNIYLVAHSMGGLVASQFVKNATASQKSRTTVITLGTPFEGAPKAVNVFENGAMFDTFLGILITNSFVKQIAPNYPSAYELLPTIRHPNYLMQEEVTLTYSQAMAFLKTRDWGLKESGGIKPMFSTANSFITGLGYGSSHEVYDAANVYHIVSSGHDTASKINYRMDGGEYRTDYLQVSNAGDGTVLAQSARNGLAASNSKVFTYTNIGDHTEMLSNATAIAKVKSLINNLRTSALGVEDEVQLTTASFDVNEKGWIVGDEIDNRRIIINVNHSGPTQLALDTGEIVRADGERLFYVSRDGEKVTVGSIWETGVGYQYVLRNNAYIVSCDETDSESQVVIRYLDDGYYEKIVEYNNLSRERIDINLADYNSKDIRAYYAASSARSDGGVDVIAISKEYTEAELAALNA